jgi:hypothetical protein
MKVGSVDSWDDQQIRIYYWGRGDLAVVKDLVVVEPRVLVDKLENMRWYIWWRLTGR